MLEKDFNSLDDDFITLWSNFILGDGSIDIIKPLRELAEKGQINAIQSWYLIKDPSERNETIDRIVDGFRGDTFNESWAIAAKFYDRDRGMITDLQNRIQWAAKNGNEFLMNRLKSQLDETDYARMIGFTAELVEATAHSTREALVYERFIELYASEPTLDKFTVNEDGFKALRPALEQRVKESPENASYKYALGKNYYFGSLFGEGRKAEIKGSEILAELAQRPLVNCSEGPIEAGSGSSLKDDDEFGYSIEDSAASVVLDGQMSLY